MILELLERLEVGLGVVAERADEVVGHGLALVDIAAHAADPTHAVVARGGFALGEVAGGVLAERAGEIGGDLLALVDVAADGADPAGALGLGERLRRGLDVGAVVIVGHALIVGEDLALHDLRDEHAVAALIIALEHVAGEHGVHIAVRIEDAVLSALDEVIALELVGVRAGLEAEALEEAERHFLRQDAERELAGALDHAAGVVRLDDGDGDALGFVRHLLGSVDDADVVLVAFLGAEGVQAVGELEQRRGVLRTLVHDRPRLRDALADRVGEGLQLGQLAFLQGGLDGEAVVQELNALERLEDVAHQAAGGRSPGAVFDDGDLAVQDVVRRDIVQGVLHVHEDAGVVGRGGENKVAAAEGLGHDDARVRLAHVVHGDVAHAALSQHGGEHVGGVFRIAVDGGVGDHHAVVLGRVGAPLVVLVDEPADVLAPHGTVQRADHADVERGGLLQQRLHLRAVLAHDVREVAAGVGQPVVLEVILVGKEVAAQRAEGAEGVGGEERAGGHVEAHHDLRPVDHRRHDEREGVLAEAERVALVHQDRAGVDIELKVVLDHVADLLVADDLRVGIAQHGVAQRLGVVGLHVMHHDVIERTAVQDVGHVLKELTGHGVIHRVEQDGLLVEQDVGVVAHAAGDGVDALEQSQTAVRCADPVQIVIDFHRAVHEKSSYTQFFVFLQKRHQAGGVLRLMTIFALLSEHLENEILRTHADALTGDLAVLEHEQRGDAHHAELTGELGLVVHVDLADLDVGILVRDLIHNGGEHLAGAAPGRPEVHQNGLVRLQNLSLEIVFRNNGNHNSDLLFGIFF